MDGDASGVVFRDEVLVVLHKPGNVSIGLVEPELELRLTAEPFVEEVSGGVVDSRRVLRELPVDLDAVEREGLVCTRHHAK